jgi:hypothetical protein
VLELLQGPERVKIVSVLARGLMPSWARVMANPRAEFVELDTGIWETHKLEFIPRSERNDGSINQTYLRPNRGGNADFYDLCLNRRRLLRSWPGLQVQESKCDVR